MSVQKSSLSTMAQTVGPLVIFSAVAAVAKKHLGASVGAALGAGIFAVGTFRVLGGSGSGAGAPAASAAGAAAAAAGAGAGAAAAAARSARSARSDEVFDLKKYEQEQVWVKRDRQVAIAKIFGKKPASEIVESCTKKNLEDLKKALTIVDGAEFVHYEDPEKMYNNFVYIRINGIRFSNIYLRAYGDGSVEVGDLLEDKEVQHPDRVVEDPQLPPTVRLFNGERFSPIFCG